MNVLFLGGVFDNVLEKEILKKSKSGVHYAANKFQWGLIDGFLELNDLKVEILSATFIGSYPKDYSDKKFKGQKKYYQNEISTNYVPFNNIWGYRSISRKNNLKHGIKDFASYKGERKTIIIYTPHSPLLQAAVYAKKIDPSIHICLLIPDLPQFMNLNNNLTLIYKALKKIDITIFENNLKFVDSFVLLTDQMKESLKVGERPYVVVEGIVNKHNIYDKQLASREQVKDCLSVVYTGTLNEKFGVLNLVKAFQKIKTPNACLKICGRGDSEETIRKIASKDQRIQLLGQLSNEEAVELQRRAAVLVNPRQNNEIYTKYSFPSKNMEYLLAGRPVIAYKLDGIPDEYDDYFFYPNDDSLARLSEKIDEVLLMSEEKRNELGSKAREYVLNEKNNVMASKKIIEMINSVGG